MGVILESTSVKYGKLFLTVAVLAVVLSEVSSARRKLDCRKYVFAPACRGIAAKRDTHSHTSDIRFTPTEDNDYLVDSQKISSDDSFAAIDGVLGLLKRTMSKNLDYDTSNNYLA